jgi:hypothetical protein
MCIAICVNLKRWSQKPTKCLNLHLEEEISATTDTEETVVCVIDKICIDNEVF